MHMVFRLRLRDDCSWQTNKQTNKQTKIIANSNFNSSTTDYLKKNICKGYRKYHITSTKYGRLSQTVSRQEDWIKSFTLTGSKVQQVPIITIQIKKKTSAVDII
jgi:hypothetical protein